MSEKLKFESCIEKVKTPQKLQKNVYLTEGKYPVVSQEDELINGYCDKDDFVFKVDSPVIIFGDHTRKVKFIDFDFVLGADGAKIFKPIPTLHPKYFYYYLTFSMPKSIGYARHYRLLKEILINVPPLEEQKAIVAKLDTAFTEIDKAIATAQRNAENAEALFEQFRNEIFSSLSQECELLKTIYLNIVDKITKLTSYNSKEIIRAFVDDMFPPPAIVSVFAPRDIAAPL